MNFSLNDLILRDMSPDEMRSTYMSHMVNVFPINEMKPCEDIYREMHEDKYLACGLFAGEELVAYVFTACVPGRTQLFGQYVVVKEEYRSMGVGGKLLDEVIRRYGTYRCFMADVEDPDAPCSEAERQTRERRMRFYTRNGFRRTRVKSLVYDVDYEIIVRDICASVDDDEVYEAAVDIYKSMANPGAFPDKFMVRLDGT